MINGVIINDSNILEIAVTIIFQYCFIVTSCIHNLIKKIIKANNDNVNQ